MRSLTRVIALLHVVAGSPLVAPAVADTIVITLDAGTIPSSLQCNETWIESGLELKVVPTSLDDCGHSLCNTNVPASSVALVLVPARLEVDLTAVPGTVQSVEAIVATVALGIEPLCLYNGSVPVDCQIANHTFPEDTLRVVSGGSPVDRLAWEPCFETFVSEILIHFDPTSTSTPSGEVVDSNVHRLLAPRSNPVRSAGQLRFLLARRADSSLIVYAVSGRLVRTITTGVLSPGPHEVFFDGRDDRGNRLPGGIYFQRLLVDGQPVDTKKFVLIR